MYRTSRARLRVLADTGAHPAVIADLLHRRAIETALEEDDRDHGGVPPGRDYTSEAADLAPLLLRAFLAPPRPDEHPPATAAAIAALHIS